MTGKLTQAFEACLAGHSGREAVNGLTYAELDARSGELAAELPGDRLRIGIHAVNSTQYVVRYLAALRAGHVPFLIDAALGTVELRRIIEDCSLDLLYQDDLVALSPDGRRHDLLPDTEVCRFSSGSTGHPNCIEFSGDAVHAAARNWAAGTGLTGEDRIACFAALSNGLAFNTSLLATFLVGGALHLGHGLPTAGKVTRFVEETGATRLVGFPALYDSLVRRECRLGDVRLAISSGAPLRTATCLRFRAVTGVAICDYYGIAETGPLTFTPDPGPDGGLGGPLPGVELRPTETEVEVRSESMASRYLNAPGVFESRLTADGFYRTGDEGRLSDGELVLTGRSGRVINVGGRKVDPIEVSEVLHGIEAVHDAAVFGCEDTHGENVVAVVVTGEPGLTVDAVRRHCQEVLPGYKIPALIELVAEIPTNSIGKPSVTALRELMRRRRSK
ncbi:class I adenylate-forming enzyme family protein [Kutzneria sp. CA-103260]|uniref:class I adenylate-forming enzyme family protein n=1 Tax=Kutzneria sp. CA-103260 TaxID=2802641 RepID=UPI001BA682BD|nr:class I adenylate-forming enzyme family protein [Kutzneria sp. CA-103260]QUQ63948.1 rifamycin polyketide synthase [Kutzneria sp. CA-103260]